MQLSPKIHLLKHPFEIQFPGGQKLPRFVYSLVIFGKDITLIDSGVKDCYNTIFDYIRNQNRKPEEIKTLILSHSHPDHIGSAYKIKELTGCKVMAHADEKEWFEHIDLQCKSRPVPGFYELVDQSVKIDEFVEHNQILKIEDNITLKILHSPGHSKGSINIHFIEDKVLFTADSVPLKNDIPNYDSYFDLMASLIQIKLNKDYSVMVSSWFAPLSEREKIEQLIEEGEEYLKKINILVNIHYSRGPEKPFESCKKVIEELKLPLLFVNPIVERAFRTHLD